MSSVSPLSLNVPLVTTRSFLTYCCRISSSNSWSSSNSSPLKRGIILFLYSWGEPRPYIQDTDETTMTSFLSSNALVAECLNLSISSFIFESFSIKVSVLGT